MNILQGILAWTARRKRQGFVLMALLLLGAGLFTFNAPKAYASPGCSCFVHTSTTANTLYNYTVLDDSPFDLSSPQEEIFVTHNWGSEYGINNPHPLGVMHIGTHWAIFNEDRAAMPVGLYFDVDDSTNSCKTVVTATTDNTFGDYTLLPNIGDFSLNPIMLVTANLEPNAVYDPHPLGVWYTGTQWSVFNEDGAAMPIGASFNVACYSHAAGTPTTVVQGSNASGSSVLINQSIDNGPMAEFLVTPNLGPNFVYDPHPLGVWYTGGKWAIFNEDGAAMPAGASFNVALL